jgi:hypothetical protein
VNPIVVDLLAVQADGLQLIRKTHPGSQETTMNRIEPRIIPAEPLGMEEASTADLVREAFDEAKELIRLEVEIAKSEVAKEISLAKKAAVSLAVAVGASVIVLCMIALAIVLAVGATVSAALWVAAVLLVIGGMAAYIGYALFPRKPLGVARDRLMTDVKQLKEHIA